MDCFRLRSLSYGGQVVAEFIIGPATGRTRWLLAMTALVSCFRFAQEYRNGPQTFRTRRRRRNPSLQPFLLADAHKGLGAETIPWCFTEKEAIAPHQSEKVPVLLDDDKAVVDSWVIANYLEDAY